MGNTLIVGVEYRKVVEVTLTGALIRTLEDGRRMSGIDNIQGVDAVGDTVCVGVSRLGIYLYDYGTGDFRAKVPEAQIPEDSRRCVQVSYWML